MNVFETRMPLLQVNLLSPRSDQHEFSLSKIHPSSTEQVMRNNKMITWGNIWYFDMLPSHFLRKCMEICLENLHVDIGVPRLHICQKALNTLNCLSFQSAKAYPIIWGLLIRTPANSVVGWTVDYQENTFELIPPWAIPQVPQAHNWESLLRNGNIIRVCMEI